VVDGIVGGQGNGPMAADPMAAGIVIAGTHPVAVDLVAATLMGFDWQKIRMLKGCFGMQQLSFVDFTPDQVEVLSNRSFWQGKIDQLDELLSFRPHFGWVGAIENARRALVA
jgi:uncharacterized protein (DUF362 family)